MKAVCVPCSVVYRCEKNEVSVEEIDPDGGPFRVRSGDLWKCPGCGHQIVTGFGRAVEAYESNCWESRYEAVRGDEPVVTVKA